MPMIKCYTTSYARDSRLPRYDGYTCTPDGNPLAGEWKEEEEEENTSKQSSVRPRPFRSFQL